jgi:hypothetical protein
VAPTPPASDAQQGNGLTRAFGYLMHLPTQLIHRVADPNAEAK